MFKRFSLQTFIVIFFLANTQSAKAQVGQALNFDPSLSNYVTLPFVLSGSYTKEAWINMDPASTGLITNIVSGSDAAFFLFFGKLTAGHTSSTLIAVQNPTPLNPNQWYHVAVTYDSVSGDMNLYQDGVLVSSFTLTPGYSDNALYIGAYQATYTWDGSMDEVRIWNVVRTQAQINAYMDSSLTGYEPGLLAYYNFNENIAGGNNTGNIADSTLYDSSYNKCTPYNGTLTSNFILNGSTSNWVSPGAPLIGTSQITYPNLKASGNSACINYNASTLSSIDSTDFGNSAGSPIFVTYTIQNNGTATLNIDSVHIGGADSSDFAIAVAPASTVSPLGSTSFIIEFAPTAIGTRNATLNIYSNDSDAIPFIYAIKGTATIILPITLQSFIGNINGSSVQLSWRTSAELNNKGFVILRSPDGVSNWQKIGYVAANSLSSGNAYAFTDASPLPGVNTYRLQQIDINGNYKFSSIVALNFSIKGSGINIYPNPAKNLINISLSDNKLLNTTAQLSTITGRVISKFTLTGNHQQIDIDKMSQGIYIVSFSNGEVQRIIKQ